MSWRAGLLLLVVVTTGCPETWRKGGAADRAMQKDRKRLEQPSLDGLAPAGAPPDCEEGEELDVVCDANGCRWVCE